MSYETRVHLENISFENQLEGLVGIIKNAVTHGKGCKMQVIAFHENVRSPDDLCLSQW